MSSLAVKSLLRTSLNVSRTYLDLIRKASTYKAAVFDPGNKNLNIKELKRSKLTDNQVRVQVAYCSVNTDDVLLFQGRTDSFVPGYEFSGEVLEVGKGVEKMFSKGNRVAALNLSNFGGLAEECVVDANDLWNAPPNLPLKDVSVIPFGHSTALYTFGMLCDAKEGQNVLISAGPAGMGLAAIDVAANIYKTKVLAVIHSQEQSELSREKGAFQTIQFAKGIEKNIAKILINGADIIYDAIGGKILEEIDGCVSKQGKIICACPTIGKQISTPPAHSTLTIVSLLKLKEHNLETYRQIVNDTLEMANEGIITAHISEKFQFKDVNEAIKYIESKKCTGKVVVKIDV